MPKPKKKPPFNRDMAIRGALRRLFARSPAVWECLRAVRREVPKHKKDGSLAKKPAVQYLCGICGTWTGSTKIAVDHKEPVISVIDGFVNWETFIDRLFCEKENLQPCCATCHKSKTYQERISRLLIQYTNELDEIEKALSLGQFDRAVINKQLTAFSSRRNTPGLEPIATRAKVLKNRWAAWLVKTR